MKKILAILAVAAFAASFTSCKKDYTCECSWNGTSIGSATIHATKGKSTSVCNELSATYALYGSGVTCKIK